MNELANAQNALSTLMDIALRIRESYVQKNTIYFSMPLEFAIIQRTESYFKGLSDAKRTLTDELRTWQGHEHPTFSVDFAISQIGNKVNELVKPETIKEAENLAKKAIDVLRLILDKNSDVEEYFAKWKCVKCGQLLDFETVPKGATTNARYHAQCKGLLIPLSNDEWGTVQDATRKLEEDKRKLEEQRSKMHAKKRQSFHLDSQQKTLG